MKKEIILLILISFTFSQAFATSQPSNDEEPTPDIPDIIEEPIPKKSNGGCSDCTSPTISYDRYGIKRVDNGVCINDICVDGGSYHTEYPMKSTLLYWPNTISLKYYENHGPSNMKMVQLGIGAKEIGSPLSESQAIIMVWLNPFKGDMYNPTIKEIIIVDPDEILAYTDGTVQLVQCMDDSNNELGCLQTDFSYSYAKPPASPILVTNGWDIPRNAKNNYINDGLNVIYYTPEILEPKKEEYICNDPIKLPMTRNNCHFREQTLLWR